MRAWIVPAGCTSSASLTLVDRPDPVPGPGQVVVRVRAASLNYRDQLVAKGQYFGGTVSRDTVPLSDGAGEVTAVGPGVTRLSPGDRVAGTFFQPAAGSAGPATLGSPLDGMLAEQVVLHEEGIVALPASIPDEAAACLPCAGVTAWHALFRAGRGLRTGDTVLVLGTGGVSIFALQFARAAGARVVATSSSDEKLARLAALGVTDVVNYRRSPDWEQEVLRLTDGAGVDCVVDVGGPGTFARALRALGRGGRMALIGFLAGMDGETSPYPLALKGGSLHGIFVGDRGMFEEMNRAIVVNGIRPVIDRVFPFEEAPAAYAHHASGAFVGKVVIAG